MNDFFRESLFAGVTLSLLSYFIGSVLKKKFKLGIFNPLLISIIITIIATQELACRKQRTVTTQVIRRAGKNLKLRVLREDQKKIGKK